MGRCRRLRRDSSLRCGLTGGRPAAGDAELLPVRTAGAAAYRISVKLETEGAVQRLRPSSAQGGRRARDRRPRGRFTLDSDSGPVLLCLSWSGSHARCLPCCKRWSRPAARAGLVAARSARQWRAVFAAECEGPRRPTPERTVRRLVQPPAEGDRIGGDYDHRPGRPGGGAGAAAAGARSRRTLRAVGVHGRPDGGAGRARGRPGSGAHRGLRRGPPDAGHRRGRGAATASPAGSPGRGPDGDVLAQRVGGALGARIDTLLELAEACDVPTRWSCRTGVCHNCETAVLAGSVDYDPEPVDRPAQGNVLICCAGRTASWCSTSTGPGRGRPQTIEPVSPEGHKAAERGRAASVR